MDGERQQRLWRCITERANRSESVGWAGVICEVVVDQVGIDAAAISVRADGRAEELVAATDAWARTLEELQYTVGEGPGMEAYRTAGPVLVTDLSAVEHRWPGYVDAAAAEGLAAVFAFPLQGGAIRVGNLDLYRRRPGGLPADGLADAAVLADLATTALLTDAAAAEPTEAVREEALGHYEDVNLATGMLAATLGLGLDDAFLRLRAHAFSVGRPLLEVARAVVTRQIPADAFRD